MATMSPLARVPFAPLDNPRLQHLASAKNRQNGIVSQKSGLSDKPVISKTSPGKRAFESPVHEDFDSENVDPSTPTKKMKNGAFENSVKPFTFTVKPQTTTMPPPSFIPSQRFSTPLKANSATPRTPLTAPAGRSPKKKIARPARRVSAPFSRIDPPFAASRGSSISTLPFSLDAALSGTLSSAKSAGATIAESMPQNWFFDIHQDTLEEEASNLMEHSTLTLDLSSDDEDSKKQDDRGKENTPPEGYDAPTASRPVADSTGAAPRLTKKTEIIRKKVVVDEMDDGSRSPLSDLETDPFFPEGLDKDSCVVVDEVEEPVEEKKDFFAVAVAKQEEPSSMPVVSKNGEVKGEIIVWEDAAAKDAA